MVCLVRRMIIAIAVGVMEAVPIVVVSARLKRPMGKLLREDGMRVASRVRNYAGYVLLNGIFLWQMARSARRINIVIATGVKETIMPIVVVLVAQEGLMGRMLTKGGMRVASRVMNYAVTVLLK